MTGTRPLLLIALAPVLALGLACAPTGPGGEPAKFETVDVEPLENMELDLSEDVQAAPRHEGGGQLPSDFPQGLPVFKPSTIADIGERGDGYYVHFRCRADESSVKSWYRRSLDAAGWSVQTAAGGVLVAERAGTRARITIEQPGPVTVVVVEY